MRMQRTARALRSSALATAVLVSACGGAGAPSPAGAKAPPAADPAACPDVAARLLRSLRSPVTVTAYATRGTPRLDTFVSTLTALLEGYRLRAPERFTLSVVEVTTDAQRAAAKAAGLQEAAFGERDGLGAVSRRGFMGLALAYRGEKEMLPILSPGAPKGLGYWIVSRLRELRDRAEGRAVRIAVIGGKGEIKLTDPDLIPAGTGERHPTLQGILAEAVPFYAIEPLDLRGGDVEIDPAIQGIVLTQPAADYTERELRRIDAFLLRGGRSVAVIAGAVNVEANDPTMAVTLDTHGLTRLLDGYGVELERALVLDWGRPASLEPRSQGSLQKLVYPALVKVEDDPHLAVDTPPLDTAFPAFFRMDEVVFPLASALVPHPERQPEATVKIVARSSPRSTLSTATGSFAKLSGALRPEGAYASYPLAIAVEGLLRSAFDGGRAPSPSRVLVIASSQFLANPFVRAAGSDEDLRRISRLYAERYLTGTILAFKDTLDWMTNDRELNACAALAPLTPTMGGK